MYCPEKNSSADGVAGRGETADDRVLCGGGAARRRPVSGRGRGVVPRQAASGSVQSVQ